MDENAGEQWQSDPSGYISQFLGSPIQITSGLRSPQKNAAVGGVPNSAHLSGQAFDFVPNGMDTKTAASKLAASGIPFDQIEDGGDHVHISFAPKLRRQVIMAQTNNISDDDLLNTLGSQQVAPVKNVSDDDLLAAMGGQQTAAPSGAPSGKPSAPMTAAPASPQSQPPNTLVDMIRSLPGGLTKGVAGIAGLPGDLNALLDAAGNKITGADIHTGQLPTSQSLNDLISKPFGGYYKPQTPAGKYTDTISQFAPAALAPGSALVRAARVAVPGAASETAGELTAGTDAEVPARIAGAMVGGLGVGGLRGLMGGKPNIPSTADIKNAASAAYDRAEQAGVTFSSNSIQRLGNEISQAVDQAGIDPTLHPRATAALGRIVNSQGDLSFNRLEILRRVANSAAGSMDKDEARIGHIILDHIDDFAENPSPGDVLSGNSQQASDAIKDARSLWATQAKSNTIDTLLQRAQNRAETVGGSGLENAIRVEFRGLAQNAGRMARFSPDEQAAIRAVARGNVVSNTARTVGKLAPTNLISILGEMAAVSADPKAIALPIAGAAGRGLATALTKSAANRASLLVRNGGAQIPTQTTSPEVLSALLARRNQDQQENQLIPSYGMP